MSQPTSNEKDAQHGLDALAQLFDDVLPSDDREALEAEMREAGIDPQAVGQRLKQLAEHALDRVDRPRRPDLRRQSVQALRASRELADRSARAPGAQRQAPALRSTRHLSSRISRVAAVLVVGFAVGWIVRGGDERAQHGTERPMSAVFLKPPLKNPQSHSPSAGRVVRDPDTCGVDRPWLDLSSGRCLDAPQPQDAPRGAVPASRESNPVQADRQPAAAPLAESDQSDESPVERPRAAAVEKTWTLDSNNWQLGKDLLPEAVLSRVKNGEYHYTVVEVDPERFKQNYSKKFWNASAANAGKYDLDPATCGLRDVKTGKVPDFYFGYPFPKIDPKDPQAACKMAQNFAAASAMGNGGGATFTLNGIDGSGEFKRITLWAHGQAFLGRSAGPQPNPEGLRASGMSGVIDPKDVDGVGGLWKTLNDWTAPDQAWFYVPATRRIRRVNAATRSDPLAGLDIFGDDINCYAGKVEYYKWKLIGEGNILAPVVSPYPLPQKQISPTRQEVNLPYLRGAYETPGAKGAKWLIVDNLSMVPRPVWILEGQSDDPYYNFGKIIMYMDKDMYRIYWKLVHNRAGEYFYNAMCAYHWSKSDDGEFSAVSPTMVVGVNDKTNRAAIAGRYASQFLESKFKDDHYFTLRSLTHMSD